jgi:hypothetical protein
MVRTLSHHTSVKTISTRDKTARKRTSSTNTNLRTAVVAPRDAALPTFERALRALAAAKNTDEVLHIKNIADAMRAYARQASDRTMQIDAVEIVMRSLRKLGLLIEKQRKTDGLAKGGGDQRSKHRGVRRAGGPITYKEAGIKSHLAKEGNRLAAIPESEFERLLIEWRREMDSAPRVMLLMRRQYNSEAYERREAGELAREKEEWIKKREGDSIGREELAVEWEKTQATWLDDDDKDPSEKQWTRRQMWEARLASNPTVSTKPRTLNSVHKIVADAITRLLALASARAVRNSSTAADYERVLQVMDDRIDELCEAVVKDDTSSP